MSTYIYIIIIKLIIKYHLPKHKFKFRVDKDRSGAISAEELQQALSNGMIVYIRSIKCLVVSSFLKSTNCFVSQISYDKIFFNQSHTKFIISNLLD